MSTLWEPIKEPGHLTDRIVQRLEDLIRSEHLQPGARLPSERDMAQLLGVSRPVLREAVKTLEAHGRLVVRHGRGVFVGSTVEDSTRARLSNLEISLNELFAMREVLEEPAAAWAAASATAEEVAILSEAFEAEERARQAPIDFQLLQQLDAAFHMQIVEIAKNRFLLQTLGVLQEMLAAGMQTTLTIPGRLERSRADHRQLFRAISRGDSAGARRAAHRHIQGAHSAAMARVQAEAAGIAR
ncbi:MAG: FadR/GntR family transcriptional regulator [Acidimicrobiales bacterium]